MLARYIPSNLRGFTNRRNYFEGWFQKIYSVEHRTSVIIIYGYATKNPPDRFGFIQILLPNARPLFYYFPKQVVTLDLTNHIVRMGNNLLSTKKILIDSELLQMDLKLSVNGPVSRLKNTMGYTYYIPNLPCYHAVVNPAHLVSGTIQFNGSSIQFNNQRGYLEKNWGTSFPQDYLWLHAIDPLNSGVSLLFSYATMHWMGKSFRKHVGHFRVKGMEIDLRELKQATIQCFKKSSLFYCISLKTKTVSLKIEVVSFRQVTFKGPEHGLMSRDILHHADANMLVSLRTDTLQETLELIGNFEEIGSFFIQ